MNLINIMQFFISLTIIMHGVDLRRFMYTICSVAFIMCIYVRMHIKAFAHNVQYIMGTYKYICYVTLT